MNAKRWNKAKECYRQVMELAWLSMAAYVALC